jgi:carboxymethylenebutenolidase
VHEKTVNIPTADGQMETFIVHPEEGGPFAPIIIYMDVWGLRSELCDIARKVAVVGYYVLLPDLYYRQGCIRHEWRDADGRMISLHKLDSARQAEVLAPARHLSNAQWSPTAAHCSTSSAGASRYARERSARSATVWAVSSLSAPPQLIPSVFTPTRACTEANSSPTARIHRTVWVRRLRGELYCGFAEKDPQAAPSIRAALDEAIAECPVEYRAVVHAGAEHGYALPDRDIHDKHAANRDWELIFAMFRRQLSAP